MVMSVIVLMLVFMRMLMFMVVVMIIWVLVFFMRMFAMMCHMILQYIIMDRGASNHANLFDYKTISYSCIRGKSLVLWMCVTIMSMDKKGLKQETRLQLLDFLKTRRIQQLL
jgi:hypothetical protein